MLQSDFLFTLKTAVLNICPTKENGGRPSASPDARSLPPSQPPGYHAGGKDADAAMAGGTDKLKYDTRAKVA